MIVAGLLLAGAWSGAGCGYALAGRGSFLPDYIRTVGIPPFENRSEFLQIEEVLTAKVRTEFIGRGNYTVVPESGGVDAVLEGEILSVSVQPVGFDERQLASRYLLQLTMRVTFTDSRTADVLWSNDALTFREEAERSSGDGSAVAGADFLDQEGSSFDRIATDVARSVVTSILEAF